MLKAVNYLFILGLTFSQSVTFDDFIWGANNSVDPGDTITFYIEVENNLGQNMLTGTANISSESEFVTITDNYGNLNNIDDNDSGTTTDTFEVIINENTPSGSWLDFTLSVNDQLISGGPWNSNFNILVQPIILTNYLVDDDENPDSNGNNNDVVEPGETIEIIPVFKNISDINICDVEITLKTEDENILVWNNYNGASEVIYDSYTLQNNNISAGTTNLIPTSDFVFQNNHSETNEFILQLELRGERCEDGSSWPHPYHHDIFFWTQEIEINRDFDDDGIIDVLDSDDDGDGYNDNVDCAPWDNSLYNADECDVCGGDGPEENYDCDGNCIINIDCNGECGGSALQDECGVCEGSGIPAGECDCQGNVNLGCGCGEPAAEENYNCAGYCNAVSDNLDSCAGGYDCLGVCGGTATFIPGNWDDSSWISFYFTGVNDTLCNYISGADYNSWNGGCSYSFGYGECIIDGGSKTADCTYEDSTDDGGMDDSGMDDGGMDDGGMDDGGMDDSGMDDGGMDDGGDDLNYENVLPDKFKLISAYPNPFNPITNIDFSIPYFSNVRIDILNSNGEEIVKLIDDNLNGGYYNIAWDASIHPSGTYLIRFLTDNHIETKKITLVK